MKFKFLIPILIVFSFLIGFFYFNDFSSPYSNDISKTEVINTPFSESTPLENNTSPNTDENMINLSPIVPDINNTLPKDNLIKFSDGGISRLTYDYNRSEVKVISNIQDLSPYKEIEELNKYDKDYFNTNSLLLITQSTNSGSIKVSVEDIAAIDKTLKIKLKYEVPEIGTADMVTWLLWVEVDKKYDEFLGEIINPAIQSGLLTH